MKLIDRSNGYIFAGIDASAVEFSKIAVRQVDWDYYRYPFVYMDALIHVASESIANMRCEVLKSNYAILQKFLA